MKEEKKEENFNFGQEKLSETAELWRDGLFLTFLLCLYLIMISMAYGNDNATWASMNMGAIAIFAWLYLPGIIDRFSGEEEVKKDADN